MKNDLDFIRDKIENSGINAPADMDEAYVMNTLEGVSPQPAEVSQAAEQPKRKRKIIPFAISAAAAVLVAAITIGVVTRIHHGSGSTSVNVTSMPGGLTLRQFNSYDEIEQEVERLKEKNSNSRYGDYNEYIVEEAADGEVNYSVGNSGSSKGSSGSSGSSSSQSHSETYRQVEGVDEADIIKTDGRYIYCVDNSYTTGSRVTIFSAEGENSRRAAQISVYTDLWGATPDEVDTWNNRHLYQNIADMYLSGSRLIVVCEDMSYAYDSSETKTHIMVYDVSDVSNISLLDTFSQSGYYNSSRMIGDTLYLVSTFSPYGDVRIPCCGRNEEVDELPADCVYGLADVDTASFMVISAYDTLNYDAQTESKSILGGVDDLYCNENNMYVYTTVWSGGFMEDSFWSDNTYSCNSQILKIDLTDGIRFVAYTQLEGMIDDQYALDEYDGNLRVATTTTDDWEDSNNLFVLNEELGMIGSVTGFARNESIKAVRYIGETAYVITYEETDPLFVIDLSNPAAPAILGEVKISGFSTMLVPIDENTLLGLGYHTENEDYTTLEVQEGFKLALFDISDKSNPRVLDSLSYVDCSSEVQYNPKALVYNADRGDYILPLNYQHWGHYDSFLETYVYEDEEYYGGVLNIGVQDGKLVEIDRVKADCTEVERCVYVGNTIYMTYYDDNDELMIDSVPYK